VIFAAYYMLPMVQRVWFNRIDREENRGLADLSRREIAVLAPLLAGMLWMGVYPKPFLERMEVSLTELIESVERRSAQRSSPIGLLDWGAPAAEQPVAAAEHNRMAR
jgi:NADH-quinone oxidoreductase subunit M